MPALDPRVEEFGRETKMTEQTKGEKMVRMDFNPSQEGVVYDVKRHTAAIIDLVEKIRMNNIHNQEAQRLCSLAQTAYEEAAMWAVKASTAK